jgi:hypothetical protein
MSLSILSIVGTIVDATITAVAVVASSGVTHAAGPAACRFDPAYFS